VKHLKVLSVVGKLICTGRTNTFAILGLSAKSIETSSKFSIICSTFSLPPTTNPYFC